ncbi:MAG: TrkH family potassium uptake protein [Brevinema sp.]
MLPSSIIYKILSITRIVTLSLTIASLVRGIFHLSVPYLPFLLSIVMFLAILNMITAYMRMQTYKNPDISISMFATFFWIMFIKLSEFEIFMVNNTYHIQSLTCSLTAGVLGIYLYENCRVAFNILDKVRIGSRFLILLSFLIVIAVGTALLMLPISITNPSLRISAIDAFFTAVSAVCVTGLTVLDISTTFSLFGKIVLLVLIQIGALGLVSITTVFLSLLGRKLSMSGRISARDSVSSLKGDSSLTTFLTFTLSFTVIVELLIAGLLLIRFQKLMPFGEAIFYSIFHAISAFCNAGFSLFSNSLIDYQSDGLINFAIMAAIVIGGMGFVVWQDIYEHLTKKTDHKQFRLTTTIALTMSAILTFGGAIAFFVTEYYYSLDMLSFGDKILASLFASVNLRTAGFNSIDIAQTSETSRLLSLVLMYIGASPGSTGGGIKTTTFFVLFSSFKASMKNDYQPVIYGRQLEMSMIHQAWGLVFNSLAWIMFVSLIICYVEHLPLSSVLYETFSAFATVGVSTGITPHLSGTSKLLLSITMIVGRVGATTVMLAFLGKNVVQKSLIQTPKAHLQIG